ncbi:MFS transporter [Burkholderia cenocepacia]|uniref:MFS transporter n=2 Tax=Burkholderia cenocepacia TaxID=95486 RepID=UPI001B921985|nr:MFS transporter [Burkholderia cenocepacia]MBR8030144.1 MFS transporter [Burkholderia cenocepacia]MBR8174022.1 MFS transporter [Burkholderia cenocepacia]
MRNRRQEDNCSVMSLDSASLTRLRSEPGAASAYRWFLLFVIWIALLLSFIDRLAWANVAPAVSSALGLTTVSLNIFVSAFFAGYVVSNVLGGLLTDRAGPRITLVAALVPLGIATFLFGSTTSVVLGILLQGLMGLAAGADFAACIKLLSSWFDRKHRAKAVGIVMTSTSIAVVLTNAFIPQLLKAHSWSSVYYVLGITTAIFGGLCFILVREAPVQDEAGEDRIPIPMSEGVRALLSNVDLVFVTIAGLGANWATWGFIFWANALMQKGYGFTAVQTGGVIAIFGVVGMLSKPLIGTLSDWIGPPRRRLAAATLLVFCGTLLWFGTRHSLTEFQFAAFAVGAVAFCWGPLVTSMVTELAGLELAGTAVGITNAIFQVGTTAVPIIVGYAYAQSGSFLAAFSVLALGPAVAVICLLFVRESRYRQS